MASKRRAPLPEPSRYYHGPDIPLRVIRRYARLVAERFCSYAYGTPHADSDVDLLVIMPARNELDQMAKISWQVPAPFPMDLIVLKPKNVKWRLEEGDSFLTEIMAKGKVLYEKADPRLGAQGRRRLPSGEPTRARKRPVPSTGRCLPTDRNHFGRTEPN
jgi:predicted nucleotidyltransferase